MNKKNGFVPSEEITSPKDVFADVWDCMYMMLEEGGYLPRKAKIRKAAISAGLSFSAVMSLFLVGCGGTTYAGDKDLAATAAAAATRTEESIGPSQTATEVPPTTKPVMTSTPIATENPTITPTPTETPMDAETLAFVEKFGNKFSDYIFYDETEKVYRARMIFNGNYVIDRKPLADASGETMGNAVISMEMEYFDGKKIQTILYPVMIDIGGDKCFHRGGGLSYLSCTTWSVKRTLNWLENGGGPLPVGWHSGDRIEFWLLGDEKPTVPSVQDDLNNKFISANKEAYTAFLQTGNPDIGVIIPNNVLFPCTNDPSFNLSHCYPALNK